MIIINKLLSEKLFKKFPERLEYISGNFPREISELTTLDGTQIHRHKYIELLLTTYSAQFFPVIGMLSIRDKTSLGFSWTQGWTWEQLTRT